MEASWCPRVARCPERRLPVAGLAPDRHCALTTPPRRRCPARGPAWSGCDCRPWSHIQQCRTGRRTAHHVSTPLPGQCAHRPHLSLLSARTSVGTLSICTPAERCVKRCGTGTCPVRWHHARRGVAMSGAGFPPQTQQHPGFTDQMQPRPGPRRGHLPRLGPADRPAGADHRRRLRHRPGGGDRVRARRSRRRAVISCRRSRPTPT